MAERGWTILNDAGHLESQTEGEAGVLYRHGTIFNYTGHLESQTEAGVLYRPGTILHLLLLIAFI